jgi:Icc-related predicted phosphoesterase
VLSRILGQNQVVLQLPGKSMKILAVSDQIIDRLYSNAVKENYPDVKMIIGCGDLPYNYLEFLVSILNVPLCYVPGNHDPEYAHSADSRAEGGTNLDGDVVYTKGLLMAGLGGSVLYSPGGPNQYTQGQMFWRVYSLLPKILLARLFHRRPLDLLITHSPPAGIHDDDDPTHRGLRAINFLLRWARPRYMLHGHTIFYSQNLKSHITEVGQTQVVNVYPFRLLEIE